MSKKKKMIVTIVTITVIVAIIGGSIFGYLLHQRNSLVAEVQPVEFLNWGYGGDEMTSYGMVTNDYNQDVYLLDGQTVSQVYVTEGQTVKAGDSLIAYDMTLSDLQLEMQELQVENIMNRITLAKRELNKLKKETPVREPDSVPKPEPEPNPVAPQKPQVDEKTKAYHYIAGDTDTRQANTSRTADGTAGNPYVIRCMPGCYVEGAYFNELAAEEPPVYVRLVVIDPATGKDTDEAWMLNSQLLKELGITYDESSKWEVETRMILSEEDDTDGEPQIPEEPTEPVIPDEPGGYTAKELAAAIRQAEQNIKNLDLERRQAQLQLEQMKKVSADGVVKASVDGVVKNVGDPKNPAQDGAPFLTVAGSQGLYVTGSLSELMLEKVKVGDTVYANSWESGLPFEATIQEISPYPSDGSNSWGEGNPNVSYYPYTAFIADTEGLKNGESVDLTMTARNDGSNNAIYLQKAYVRQENGRSYVFMADENNRLKKQYVETGKTLYGEAVEIKSGLLPTDRIAFPYGKTAKEGVKVKDTSEDGTMYYDSKVTSSVRY